MIVEGPDNAPFTRNVIEQPHTLLDSGETCSLTSTTASCDPNVTGLACVGVGFGAFTLTTE
ncbi:MAG: hypothetical protein FJ137_09930 [Deltaproteobacteria bacterium]|nr:hypothetical protein [Deltaproteobacteria bacterium]